MQSHSSKWRDFLFDASGAKFGFNVNIIEISSIYYNIIEISSIYYKNIEISSTYYNIFASDTNNFECICPSQKKVTQLTDMRPKKQRPQIQQYYQLRWRLMQSETISPVQKQ